MTPETVSIELSKNLSRKLDAAPSLSPGAAMQISKVMNSYIDAQVEIEAAANETKLITKVDFPEFVSDLVQGVFDAIVDASIEQMEAYSELIESITASVDQFTTDNLSDNQARDFLVDEFGDDLFESSERPSKQQTINCDKLKRMLVELDIELAFDCPPTEKQLAAIRNALEIRCRQKLLTTTVLKGINRIVVSDT